jgi:hypothetical protein
MIKACCVESLCSLQPWAWPAQLVHLLESQVEELSVPQLSLISSPGTTGNSLLCVWCFQWCGCLQRIAC